MKKSLLIALAFIVSGFNSIPLFAASQNECAIWICLPSGFPSGCGAAKSAFKNRIKHHKSPLPEFSSCAVGSGNSKMSYKQGKAAYVSTCNKRFSSCSNATRQLKKDATCTHIGCQSKNYIDIKADGEAIGSTYYY